MLRIKQSRAGGDLPLPRFQSAGYWQATKMLVGERRKSPRTHLDAWLCKANLSYKFPQNPHNPLLLLFFFLLRKIHVNAPWDGTNLLFYYVPLSCPALYCYFFVVPYCTFNLYFYDNHLINLKSLISKIIEKILMPSLAKQFLAWNPNTFSLTFDFLEYSVFYKWWFL